MAQGWFEPQMRMEVFFFSDEDVCTEMYANVLKCTSEMYFFQMYSKCTSRCTPDVLLTATHCTLVPLHNA